MPYTEDRTCWIRILTLLMNQFRTLNPDVAVINLPRPGEIGRSLESLRHAAEDLRIVSKEHDAAIDAAIDTHTIQLAESGIEGVAKSWLAIRVSTAMTLVGNLAMPCSDRAPLIFGAPQIADQEVIRFLLKEWWYDHGVELYSQLK